MRSLSEKVSDLAHNIESEVLTKVEGTVGFVTLNRPKALNALNLSMICDLLHSLEEWRVDPSVKLVMICGAGGKAFCAGGDVRSAYAAKQNGDWSYIDALFRKEYTLNFAIHQFPKPYVALIDGICMGGGLGVSVHGTHRIVTERTVMAMPESTIGFHTDIGASYFLNRCPGKLGIYIGLLGESMTAADALYCGLATHFVSSSHLGELSQQIGARLSTNDTIENVLDQFSSKPHDHSFLEQHQDVIDRLFEGQTIEEIFLNLEREGTDFSLKCLQTLKKKSPTSLKMILALLLKNKNHSLRDCLIHEFRLSKACVRGHDFFEGVRALLVDKDRKPHWSPASIAEVSDKDIEHCFDSLGDEELVLPRS